MVAIKHDEAAALDDLLWNLIKKDGEDERLILLSKALTEFKKK